MPETSSASISLAPGPLFVVGIWRSGTSLLYTLLNQHPQIALMYEADFLTLGAAFRWPGKVAHWPARFENWNASLSRHGIDPTSLSTGISTLGQASEEVYKNFARKNNAYIWGEKSPNYYDSLRSVAARFPEARFLVIWRDPASICRSVLRAAQGNPWFAKRGITLRALLGCEILKKECDVLRAKRTRLHEINYRDLTSQPPKVMQGVCEFLEIPFDARMTVLENADRSAIYEGEHHSRVRSAGIAPAQTATLNLPDRLSAKIERYVARWRRKYAGSWTALAAFPGSTAAEPSAWERLRDAIGYRFYRLFDFHMRLFYCWAPLSLVHEYKVRKRRHDAVSIQTRRASGH